MVAHTEQSTRSATKRNFDIS